MTYYFNPVVTYLLINETSEKVKVLYNENDRPFKMPLIGSRPPYYAYPIYQEYFPVI